MCSVEQNCGHFGKPGVRLFVRSSSGYEKAILDTEPGFQDQQIRLRLQFRGNPKGLLAALIDVYVIPHPGGSMIYEQHEDRRYHHEPLN